MRARNIKPGFYKNEELAECSFPARLLFPGLWMMADRVGRMEFRPKRIKAELMPFDVEDVSLLLDELQRHGLIRVYEVNGQSYLWIPGFKKHQNPHVNEKDSVLPAHPEDPDFIQLQEQNSTSTGVVPEQHSTSTGAIGLIPSSLIPSSLNPESRKAEEPTRARPFLDKPEPDPKAPPAAAAAFEFELPDGQMVRLLQRDVDTWAKSYRYVDVTAELQCIADKPTEARAKWTKANWFGTLSAWLRAANARAKAANPDFDPNDPDGSLRDAKERAEQEAEFRRQGIPAPGKAYTNEDYLLGRVPGTIGFQQRGSDQDADSLPDNPGALVAQLAEKVAATG